MQISGLYYLFPQHCTMPTFTHKQHAVAVNGELSKETLSLDKKAKKYLPRVMANLMENIMVKQNAPPQRVDEAPTPEGVS